MTSDGRTLKARLAAGELTIGSWVTLGHPSIAEIMSRAGFDWLVLDTEHSVLSTADVQSLVRAVEPTGCSPIVRLASNDAVQIKRVMDAGAHGIMVPMVLDAQDARAAVDAVYYPPLGSRGVGLARAQGYGVDFEEYRDRLRERAVVIVMIEHHEAVANIDEILAVDGVDGYIIGPYDLSASLGAPGDLDGPATRRLIDMALAAGDRAGKPGGLHVVEPDCDALLGRVRDGFRFLGYSMDVRILDACVRRDLQVLGRRTS